MNLKYIILIKILSIINILSRRLIIFRIQCLIKIFLYKNLFLVFNSIYFNLL